MLLFLCGLCERGLEHSHQVCQMPNIWHLTHQTPKYEPNKVFQIPKILAHCYSTVSNMRRYGYKCQTKQLIFYSTFSLSSQYFIQHFLSLLTDLSFSNPCSLSLSSLDQIPSPSFTLKSTVRRHCGCGSSRPHQSSCCHRFSFEDFIVADLKTPSLLV